MTSPLVRFFAEVWLIIMKDCRVKGVSFIIVRYLFGDLISKAKKNNSARGDVCA